MSVLVSYDLTCLRDAVYKVFIPQYQPILQITPPSPNIMVSAKVLHATLLQQGEYLILGYH